jgi:hypothetical protein
MKLTKLQRYTAYCILLEEADNPSLTCYGDFSNSDGICYMWDCVTKGENLFKKFEITLPELFNKRSRLRCDYFWHTWKERIEALKQCIIETHP